MAENRTTTTTATAATRPIGSRSLALFRFLVTALIVFVSAYLLYSCIALFASGRLVMPLEVGGLPDGVDLGLPSGASVYEADFLIDVEAGFGHRILWWIVTDLVAVVGLPFLFLLRRVIAKGTEPFTADNASRLRWMAILAVIAGVIGVLRPIMSTILQGEIGFEGFSGTFIDPSDLIMAVGIGGLLEIWRHGITLKTEQELTV